MAKPRTRQLYVCVYRRHIPTPAEWRATVKAASDDPRLRQFLDEYWREDSYFDWGDDPAFFAAREAFGDPRRASWAVCRPNVRGALREGDAVAFFCGKQVVRGAEGVYRPAGPYDYFYVGCGTVGRLVDRRELWRDDDLAPYRDFYNVLARPSGDGVLEQHETFLPYHPNWLDRAASPAVMFDVDRSAFNIHHPHRVAHYDPADGPPERWRTDTKSRQLEGLLFGDSVKRRLRTSKTGFAHAHLRRGLTETAFEELRDALLALADAHDVGMVGTDRDWAPARSSPDDDGVPIVRVVDPLVDVMRRGPTGQSPISADGRVDGAIEIHGVGRRGSASRVEVKSTRRAVPAIGSRHRRTIATLRAPCRSPSATNSDERARGSRP